jgi:hypothetical protein
MPFEKSFLKKRFSPQISSTPPPPSSQEIEHRKKRKKERKRKALRVSTKKGKSIF